MKGRKKTPEELDDAKIALILGYRGFNDKVYHNHCLCRDESILYDKSKPVTKSVAYKENLICDICQLPICSPKYSKFLKRVADAKRHRTT